MFLIKTSDMELSFLSIVLLLSFLNGLAFSLLAISKVGRDKNNIYVAIILFLVALIFFDEFSRWTPAFIKAFPGILFVFTVSWFLVLPFIYLMIRYQVKGILFKWYDIFHLATSVAALTIGGYFVSNEVKQHTLLSLSDNVEPHDGKLIFSVQIIIYICLVLFFLTREYKYRIGQLLPRLSSWLKAILIMLGVYLIFMWIYIVGDLVFHLHFFILDTWKTNFFLLFIYGWLYVVINDPSVFKYPIQSKRILDEKLKNGNVSKELRKIVDQISTQKIFLDKGLTQITLAKHLAMSGRKITDLINAELGISVSQLLNMIRIREMESRYHDPEYSKYSLEGLASSVGFSSKSSFYRNFKQFKGLTPSIYFDRLSK